PYDQARIVGGSSGGEGAIVAAAASPFGLGSDIGGSIRMPSFFNGIFGHKPTVGIIDNTGAFPVPENDSALAMLTPGPMARYAEDLMPLLKVMATDSAQLGEIEHVKSQRLRVINVAGTGLHRVSRGLRATQQNLAE